MRPIYTTAVLAMLAVRSVAAQAPTITWGPAPAIFPAGARMAVLEGDPGKAAMFTVRLEMPDGYKIAAHTHPTDEHVTIIKGTLLLGMGDRVDAAQATALPTGAFSSVTANMHHFAVAKGQTIVQVNSMGPFVLTYVNPADDPTRNSKTKAKPRQ